MKGVEVRNRVQKYRKITAVDRIGNEWGMLLIYSVGVWFRVVNWFAPPDEFERLVLLQEIDYLER